MCISLIYVKDFLLSLSHSPPSRHVLYISHFISAKTQYACTPIFGRRVRQIIREINEKNGIYKKTYTHTETMQSIAKQNKTKRREINSQHTARMKEMAKIDMYIYSTLMHTSIKINTLYICNTI